MIELIEETGTLFPYLGGSSLISSFFADDVLFFCKASIDQARVVNLVLHEFCRAFGLKVNLDNYIFNCSLAVPQRIQDEISNILEISCTNHLGSTWVSNL